MSRKPFKMKGNPIKLGTIKGTSAHSSALKQQQTDIISDYVAEKAPGYLARNTRILGKALAPVSIVSSLTGMYASGQANSGGRTGYEKNPNWDGVVKSGEDRFGGSEGSMSEDGKFIKDDGTAQFRRSYTANTISEKERRWKNKQASLKSQEESKVKEENRKAKNQWNSDSSAHGREDHKQRNNPNYGPHQNQYHDYPGSTAYLKNKAKEEGVEYDRRIHNKDTDYEYGSEESQTGQLKDTQKKIFENQIKTIEEMLSREDVTPEVRERLEEVLALTKNKVNQ